ncbi:androgen-dependent TFPI-regulating protein-like isoform X1 [Myxocyprinus asiaticus]|uniref:androgen-dependent TFPI-regulating protein-like isoform X1 n=1 Tax=Myxocyprinus asiaticus TaxID=70543 RepID=UPI0022221DB1|nr:androgen-dependent TFPI-regulating protein-like isoform X1 [Myxocyprinus asiaticus]
MTAILKKVCHLAAFSWYAFVIKSIYARGDSDLPDGIFVYGGPWKYLTFLNLVLQMVFFGLASVNDLQPVGKASKISLLCLCKDLLFSVFVFPVGMFVVLLFWLIFAYDRQLVYPASLDSLFPPWINHAMHTLVLPILLGEILLEPHIYPKTKNGLAALGIVGLAYLGWVIWVYLTVGIWVYPLLGLFSSSGLTVFFLHNMLVVTLLYILGQNLNKKVWGEKRREYVFLSFILCYISCDIL